MARLQGHSTVEQFIRKPCHVGYGNVVWPAGYSEQQRREWRVMMELPGAEWWGVPARDLLAVATPDRSWNRPRPLSCASTALLKWCRGAFRGDHR